MSGLLWLFRPEVQASPGVSIDNPVGFFTNVAARLLKSELNLDLNQIQLHPTNQYTPAVHRLLQVTANLYDAMTNRTFGVAPEGFPSVFRPVFLRTPTNLIISGYQEVTDADTFLAQTSTTRDLLDTNYIASLPIDQPIFEMFTGVPLVIGARKGFPNFNRFSMQTAVMVSRKLDFYRADMSSVGPLPPRQIIMAGISNVFAAELWNSYMTAYPRPRQLVFESAISAYLTTNQQTGVIAPTAGYQSFTPARAVYYLPSSWPGCPAALTNPLVINSFLLPLNTSWWHMNPSTWRVTPEGQYFEPLSDVPDPNCSTPQWWLNLRTRVLSILIDTSVTPHRIIDYVNLDAKENPVDILAALMTGSTCTGTSSSPGSMWCTNEVLWQLLSTNVAQGIVNQISASLGWGSVNWGLDQNYRHEIDFFRYNYGLAPIYGTQGLTRTNHFFAPYVPARTIYLGTSWQANDPLVHYTVGDMTDAANSTRRVTVDVPPANGSVMANLRQPNTRYEPWGGNPAGSYAATRTDLKVKDPLVTRSDDWDFPLDAPQDLAWLGSVHRGTPWQTWYLKSTAVDVSTWKQWTGDMVLNDSQFMHPTNDWHLARLLVSLLSTNQLANRASANQLDTYGWTRLLDKIVILTNTLTEADWQSDPFQAPQFEMSLMQFDSPQALSLGDAIANLRSRQPGQYFRDPGDILAAPELSVASPWLNTTGSLTVLHGISDAAYEAIPSRLLPRLRPDSVGAVTLASDRFTVQFTGVDDCTYVVETSSNLMDWVPVSTNVPVNGSFTYQEAQQPACRFYRSVVSP